MDNPLTCNCPRAERITGRSVGLPSLLLGGYLLAGSVVLRIGVGKAYRRLSAPTLAVIRVQLAECRAAQPHRLFQHRVEHRREVAGRRIDDL